MISPSTNANFKINTEINTEKKTEQSSRTKQVEEIKETHKESQAARLTQLMSEVQSLVEAKSSNSSFEITHQEFQDFLGSIGYDGKVIASLSKDEAADLVSEDGFFGVTQTSERIAGFVIAGAGGDEALLREGRKGILQGFDDAEAMWGEKLPEISYETINKAVEMIDKALVEAGYSVLDEKA